MPASNRHRRRGAPRSRLPDLRREAIDQAEALTSSQEWGRLLRYAQHFHQFGGTNALLILRNRPHATRLATYEEWRRDGQQVRRGERALALIDPTVPSKTMRVFDITQTGEPPAPGPLAHIRPARHSPPALLTALTSIAMRKGFDVLHDSPDAAGRTAFGERSIHLHPALTAEAAGYALAHELGHVVLHRPTDPRDTTGGCNGRHLIEAESIAYIVCRNAGLDVAPFRFLDPPTWAGDDPRANRGRTILHAIDRISATAHAIITQVDAIDRGRHLGTQSVQERTKPEQRSSRRAHARLIEIQQRAERFFTDRLPGSWVPGYLAARGLASALDEDAPWRLGYAPESWTALVDHLHAADYTDDEILTSGLATRSRTGGLIDRFRDRAMIPVRSPDGTTVAFIGRANPDRLKSNRRPVPKYLNSPQTPLYTKGAVLFGLDVARPSLDAGATPVLVEGALDAISVHIADTDHKYAPVAPSGTALTDQQVAALRETVDLGERGILVAFDGDPAGRHAAVRAHGILRDHTDRTHHAVLAPGEDPAGLLQDHGPDRLVSALAKRQPLATAVLDEHLNSTRCLPTWERRDQAARLITALAPADVVQRLADASLPGPGSSPGNAAPLSPAAATTYLPATVNHLVFHAAQQLEIDAAELMITLVDTASEQAQPAAGLSAGPDHPAPPSEIAARDSPAETPVITSSPGQNTRQPHRQAYAPRPARRNR